MRSAVVIGAGAAGLAAAGTLKDAGYDVVIVEAAAGPGGLARAIHVGGEPIEAYYHHIFPQDHETLELIEVLGLGDLLEWRKGGTAVLNRGRIWALDGPIDLLRLGLLPPIDRVRAGLATSLQVIRRDHARMSRTSAAIEARRWFGTRAFEVLWRPLLEAKFGPELAGAVPMSWLAARMRQRAKASGVRGEHLGYLRGSLGVLLHAYMEALVARGVTFRFNQRVTRLQQVDDAWSVVLDGETDPIHADVVVAALAGPVLQRIVALPDRYRSALESIPYRGVACVLVELDRALTDHYWINVTERLRYECVGIIEHTNFIPPDRYGGKHLLYLAHYVDLEGEAYAATAEQLLEGVEPILRQLNPSYSRSWVTALHVTKDPFAQPVPQVDGWRGELPLRTGLTGLYHASLAHIFPDDRGVSMALRLGMNVAGAALADGRTGRA